MLVPYTLFIGFNLFYEFILVLSSHNIFNKNYVIFTLICFMFLMNLNIIQNVMKYNFNYLKYSICFHILSSTYLLCYFFYTETVVTTTQIISMIFIIIFILYHMFFLVKVIKSHLRSGLNEKVNPIFQSFFSNYFINNEAEAGYTQHEVCSICLEESKTDLYKTKCNHIFHTECINDWLVKNITNFSCPICRSKII